MTDLELAAALRDALAILRTASPTELPHTRAVAAELARVAGPSSAAIRPILVSVGIHEPAPRPRPAAIAEPSVPAAIEQRIGRALADMPRPGESIDVAFRRKEAELGAAFSELAPLEARALQRRLARPAPGDAIAAQFARLVPERRARLLAYLGAAHRREALKRGAA